MLTISILIAWSILLCNQNSTRKYALFLKEINASLSSITDFIYSLCNLRRQSSGHFCKCSRVLNSKCAYCFFLFFFSWQHMSCIFHNPNIGPEGKYVAVLQHKNRDEAGAPELGLLPPVWCHRRAADWPGASGVLRQAEGSTRRRGLTGNQNIFTSLVSYTLLELLLSLIKKYFL